MGDILFTAIHLCRYLNIPPSNALNIASNKFKRRLYYVEEIARKNRINMASSSFEELQRLWKNAKQQEKQV